MTSNLSALNFKAAVELCGGKEAIAREIIQMLVNELPLQVAELQAAMQQQNWEELDYISHKLSGSAAYCGMEEIKLQARTLNNLVRRQEFDHIPLQFQTLQQAITDALAMAATDLQITPQLTS